MSETLPTQGRPEASSLRIVLTLCFAGVIAGLLLVVVYQLTQPRIQAYKAEQLKLAVEQVLQEPASYRTLYLVDDALTETLPSGALERDYPAIYEGFDADGNSVGFALVHGKAGFQDIVRVIFGYDPHSRRMLGMKVLESKETPGLGDKIELDLGFVEQFQRVEVPLRGVKVGAGSGDVHEVDMITGATISSKVVIEIINAAIEEWDARILAGTPTTSEAKP